jgi:pimeloyl-ACP methyl ester carboxylesterase
MTGMRDNLAEALMGNTGWLNPMVSDFVDQVYEAWSLPSATEIMLVGFSNGGQQMQNYAAAGKYRDRVIALVLFGAPLTRTADEITADSLLIQDLGDNTYALYTHNDAVISYDDNDSDRKTIFATGKVSSTDTHTLATYQSAAIAFDKWLSGPGYRADWTAIGSDIQRFSGVVIRSPRSIQIS